MGRHMQKFDGENAGTLPVRGCEKDVRAIITWI
jgi:hypothetical protein